MEPQQQLQDMDARIVKLEKSFWRLELYAIIALALGIIRLIQGIPSSAPPNATPTAPPNQIGTSNVKIATGHETLAESDSRRDYFTVEEVADKEGVAPRTIITWIAENRIQPPPAKPGRAWLIPKDYRYQPPTAASSN